MPDQGSGSEVAYRAFISYSHLDAAAGRRLHRRLESYAVPKRLVGTQTPRGPVPARLSPIFRDLDELPAAGDLSEEIKAALAASAALIVVCSPAAKASRWVTREIETFRALHGASRPVLAALIAGEPDTAFPDALYDAPVRGGRIDPAAADFRKGGEGSRLALMKLVAGLTGTNLDALVQRDAQARIRRVTAVTVVAITAMLIMALLLVMAVRSQNEARRQRAKAEGLVEYMLTDLRDRLKGVGRLDVMTAVNERAMAYYGDQAALDDLSPDSLDRRARILHAMGEDDEKRGDLAAALAKFKEAHRATAAVLAKRPDDPDAIFAHAQSEYWVGSVYREAKDYKNGGQRFQNYLGFANALNSVDPDRKRAGLEVGYAYSNLGQLQLLDRADPVSASAYFGKALASYRQVERIAPQDIELRIAMANGLAWLADSRFKSKEYKAAIAERAGELAYVLRLLEHDPNNKDYKYRLVVNSRARARAEMGLGNAKTAISLLRQAQTDLGSLRLIDPKNASWNRQATMIRADLAQLQQKGV